MENSEQMFDNKMFFSKCKLNKNEGPKAEVCKVQTEITPKILMAVAESHTLRWKGPLGVI